MRCCRHRRPHTKGSFTQATLESDNDTMDASCTQGFSFHCYAKHFILNDKCIISQVVVFWHILRLSPLVVIFDIITTTITLLIPWNMHKVSSVCKLDNLQTILLNNPLFYIAVTGKLNWKSFFNERKLLKKVMSVMSKLFNVVLIRNTSGSVDRR